MCADFQFEQRLKYWKWEILPKEMYSMDVSILLRKLPLLPLIVYLEQSRGDLRIVEGSWKEGRAVQWLDSWTPIVRWSPGDWSSLYCTFDALFQIVYLLFPQSQSLFSIPLSTITFFSITLTLVIAFFNMVSLESIQPSHSSACRALYSLEE